MSFVAHEKWLKLCNFSSNQNGQGYAVCTEVYTNGYLWFFLERATSFHILRITHLKEKKEDCFVFEMLTFQSLPGCCWEYAKGVACWEMQWAIVRECTCFVRSEFVYMPANKLWRSWWLNISLGWVWTIASSVIAVTWGNDVWECISGACAVIVCLLVSEIAPFFLFCFLLW